MITWRKLSLQLAILAPSNSLREPGIARRRECQSLLSLNHISKARQRMRQLQKEARPLKTTSNCSRTHHRFTFPRLLALLTGRPFNSKKRGLTVGMLPSHQSKAIPVIRWALSIIALWTTLRTIGTRWSLLRSLQRRKSNAVSHNRATRVWKTSIVTNNKFKRKLPTACANPSWLESSWSFWRDRRTNLTLCGILPRLQVWPLMASTQLPLVALSVQIRGVGKLVSARNWSLRQADFSMRFSLGRGLTELLLARKTKSKT